MSEVLSYCYFKKKKTICRFNKIINEKDYELPVGKLSAKNVKN